MFEINPFILGQYLGPNGCNYLLIGNLYAAIIIDFKHEVYFDGRRGNDKDQINCTLLFFFLL